MKIRITASQTVRYDQTVEMTEQEWERIKSLPPREAAIQIDGWLDHSNVRSADEVDDSDFEAWAVDDDNKRLKPNDEYFDPE